MRIKNENEKGMHHHIYTRVPVHTDIIIILFCEIVNVVTVSLLYNMLQVCHVARHLYVRVSNTTLHNYFPAPQQSF